jgi:ribosome-associated toxin RatA of RatAB toxin-antitoxin module
MLALLLALAAQPLPEPEIVPLEDEGTPGVRVSFVVEADAPLVLDMLWDVARFREIFPDIKALSVLRSSATQADVKFDVDAVIAAPTYTLRRELRATDGEIVWRAIAGDLKRIVGRWIVTPHARGAHVVYESFVDVGVPGVSTIYRDVAKTKLDQMIVRVRAGAARALARRAAQPAP